MSPVGRWSAISAATLGLITVGVWNEGATPSAVDAEAIGAQLFRAKGCASCHAGPASPAPLVAGFPSLANAPDWAGDRRPGLSAEDYLTESIAAPNVFMSPVFRPGQSDPTTGMPQLRITGDEIDSLVDYLLQR